MDFGNILAEIAAQVAAPSMYERTIPEDELRRFAMAMLSRGYVPDERVLAAAEKYLQGYALWIVGDVGTGKTTFFRALPVYQPQGRRDRERVILNMGRLLGQSIEDVREFLTEHRDDELVIDDIGKEPLFVEYGTRFEILPWIVEERVEVRARTHYTSNYGKKYFDERYGYGLFDRVYTSAYFAEWRGQSRRTLSPRVKYSPPASRSPAAPQSRPVAPTAAGNPPIATAAPKQPPETPAAPGSPPAALPQPAALPGIAPEPPRSPQEPPKGSGRGNIPPSRPDAPELPQRAELPPVAALPGSGSPRNGPKPPQNGPKSPLKPNKNT